MTTNFFKCTQLSGIFAVLLLILTAGVCQAQTPLTPGNIPFETKWLKTGKYEMGCYVLNGGQEVEFSSFLIDIVANKETLAIYTTLNLTGSDNQRVDTAIADGKTFLPIYRSSYNDNYELQLHYGKEVIGYHYDKKSRKRTAIKEPVNTVSLDSYCYPYLLGLLPLTSGYSASIPVYDYKPGNKDNFKKALVEEVTSGMYTSSLTGAHKVWLVSVQEQGANEKYVYYIDKETRRLWKVDIITKGQHLVMLDRETDYTTIKGSFDKVATMKLIKSGSAVISGQIFARDNQNEGALSGIAVLNINKKQHAKTGVSVVLIPYTDYFKEWIKMNETARKKGKGGIPLPKEAADCIKVTSVYDDKGHFEFVNLMPGEYLVFTEFGYEHTSIRSEVTGYTDTYVNGLFQGTHTHTTVRAYGSNASASVKKIVKIDKEGEKVEVKLKKTL